MRSLFSNAKVLDSVSSRTPRVAFLVALNTECLKMQSEAHAELKDRERSSWTQVVPGWRKHDQYFVGATAPVTERMLALLRLAPKMRVLDIAAGTGEPAIPAAERVGPLGTVVGTDFVEEMLAFAREKASRRGLKNVDFKRVDGERLEFPDGTFDAVSIRWGIMFMPDPVECLRQAHRVLKSAGRIAVACWADPDRNPWASVPMAIIRSHLKAPAPTAGAPGIFAFASEERLRSALQSAGFRAVSVDAVEVTMADFNTGLEYFTFLREIAGPVATLFGQVPADKQSEVVDEIARQVAGPGGRVVLKGRTWIASADK